MHVSRTFRIADGSLVIDGSTEVEGTGKRARRFLKTGLTRRDLGRSISPGAMANMREQDEDELLLLQLWKRSRQKHENTSILAR